MNQIDNLILMNIKSDDPSPVFNWKDKRIIIVEDDYANYLLFQEMLSPAKVCLIRSVSYGEAFEMIYKRSSFDLAIVNINMSGNENCKAVNLMKLLWPDMPVLAISSCSDCKRSNKPCYPMGCDMMISFNVDSRQLMETVQEMFNPAN
jgi:CheY-like chemotaxis protein